MRGCSASASDLSVSSLPNGVRSSRLLPSRGGLLKAPGAAAGGRASFTGERHLAARGFLSNLIVFLYWLVGCERAWPSSQSLGVTKFWS